MDRLRWKPPLFCSQRRLCSGAEHRSRFGIYVVQRSRAAALFRSPMFTANLSATNVIFEIVRWLDDVAIVVVSGGGKGARVGSDDVGSIGELVGWVLL
ncbi:Hypothetical predicted protein, partial [Olea europaea subsp. europaea]